MHARAYGIVALDGLEPVVSREAHLTRVDSIEILIIRLVGGAVRHGLMQWVLRLVQYDLLQLAHRFWQSVILLGQIFSEQRLALIASVVQLIDLVELLLSELIAV